MENEKILLTGAEANLLRKRENMNEFAGCAQACKLFRELLFDKVKHLDAQATGRLTGIFKKINMESDQKRGYRDINLSIAKQYLIGQELNRYSHLDNCIECEQMYFDIDFQTMVFKYLKFNAPMGATHAKLFVQEIGFPDFKYNAETKVYEPQTPSYSDNYEGDYLEISETHLIHKIRTFINYRQPMKGRSQILIVGVEFFQNVGDIFYLFQTGNAMKVIQVE